MNVNGYLARISRSAIVRDSEKESIQRSFNRLRLLLRRHFKRSIIKQITFGSYSRRTILPRRMDEKSDVDVLIVFQDDGSQPQTYLDRLRRFVVANYAQSEIQQSHPTIQLSLNHITFDLVPALESFWGEYKIPIRESDYTDWTGTSPTSFNDNLTEVNKDHRNMVKPLVRIMKYWNASAGYPFESYALEQRIVEYLNDNMFLFGSPKDLKGYTFNFIDDGIDDLIGFFEAEWRRQAVSRLKATAEEIQDAEKRLNLIWALGQLQEILPPTWPLPMSQRTK